MRGREVEELIAALRTDTHRFVKWWRKENDFVDYDLLERFLKYRIEDEEIDGLELLSMDDMWKEVKRMVGERIDLIHEKNGERIRWIHKVKNSMRTDYCMFTPTALLAIFDMETDFNAVGA
jgi:hypothetical protein